LNTKTAITELDKVASLPNFKTLILSYNTEGIMPKDKIIATLKKYGA
jgi:adenine-specific DNA-methyltransferase